MGDWLIGLLGGPDNAQALGAIFSAITAAVAVIIAIWNGYITRQEARFSVAPALSVWADYPGPENPTCVVLLNNKGFGPAISESLDFFLRGEKSDGLMFDKARNAIRNAFKGVLDDIERVSSGEKGHAFGAGDEMEVIRFSVDPVWLQQYGDEAFSEVMKSLSLVIRYHDIYRRKWVFMVREFDGHTYRVAWWNLSYQIARKRYRELNS